MRVRTLDSRQPTFDAEFAELVEVDGGHFDVIEPRSAAWARTLEVLEALP